MALDRKFEHLLRLRPDIAVISETAHPDIIQRKMGTKFPECSWIWIGNNPNKGLGLFVFNGIRCELDSSYTPSHRYIAPVRIKGVADLNLLAVWAQNNSENQRRKNIPGPFRTSLDTYSEFLSGPNSVVLGDFNNNVIWDKPGWSMNHADAVEVLASRQIESVYHRVSGEVHGRESRPTHYWRDRKEDGWTFHIDFMFASTALLSKPYAFDLGSFDDWCGNGLSDHLPLSLDISL